MRADTRTTRKTAYRNSIYVQGNTARRLEVLPQIEQPHRFLQSLWLLRE